MHQNAPFLPANTDKSSSATDWRRQLSVAAGLAIIALGTGCAAEGPDDSVSADETQETASTSQPMNGQLKTTGCDATQKAKLQQAVTYAYNRVKDGQYVFAECLNRSYLWGANGQNGWQIAPMLAANTITNITCKELGEGVEAQAGVGINGEYLDAAPAFIYFNSIQYMAAVIVHEILHNRGFNAGDFDPSEPHYFNNVTGQGESCIYGWSGNASVDKGYVLWWNGAKVGNEPTWSRDQAVANCQWNKQTYPSRKVECFYSNARLGYELYRNGSGISSRVGFEPGWTRAQAIANCQSNKTTYPSTRHECLFDGARLGYELYWNGSRVGQEPTWTMADAIANCSWNKTTYPSKKVECYFNGKGVGYELFFDGKRVGHEPAWSQADGTANCSSNKTRYPNTVVDCLFNGVRM